MLEKQMWPVIKSPTAWDVWPDLHPVHRFVKENFSQGEEQMGPALILLCAPVLCISMLLQ